LEEDEEKKIIYQAIATLSPREREIIELRFGLSGEKEMTQKDVADALGISQSYISRLEKRILLQLREEIRDKI
jgi:RNA polymerase sporulation-specific sigma factor